MAPDEIGKDLEIGAAELLSALKESDPNAFVSEQERGWFVIDGKFNLREVAARLSEKLEKRSA